MVYGGILAGFGATAVAFSLAEMASMYVLARPFFALISYLFSRDPTVGAQYRWSARFAPAAPRFWALIQGT
jgi:choline transport protein